MSKLKIAVIVGSTRIGRFAEHPAKWIAAIAAERHDIEVEVLDLLDYPMHFSVSSVPRPLKARRQSAGKRSCVNSTASFLPSPSTITLRRRF